MGRLFEEAQIARPALVLRSGMIGLPIPEGVARPLPAEYFAY